MRFLDLSGVDEMGVASKALRRRSLKMAIVRMEGQPLRVLRQLLLDAKVGPAWTLH